MSNEDDPSKKYSDQQIFDMIRLHLSYYASTQLFCIAKDGPKRELKCSCRTAFHDNGICAAVAAFLMEFGKLNLEQQQKKVMKCLHYHKAFLLENEGKQGVDK
jgi:hypothetical protein